MGFGDAACSPGNARQPEEARQRGVPVRVHKQWPELQRLCLHESDQLGLDWRGDAKLTWRVSIHRLLRHQLPAPLLSTALAMKRLSACTCTSEGRSAIPPIVSRKWTW